MAGYRISRRNKAVTIELSTSEATKDQVLQAFAECQEGRCACPTDEYKKLASMEVRNGVDLITIRLEAKPGETLDASQIEACLDYTTDQAG